MIQSVQLKASKVVSCSNERPQPCRVLVVEDHVDSAIMLSTFLSMAGHLVRVAHNADMALDIAHEFQPNVCLCDIGLPKTSGYELAPLLRSQLPKMLLIAVTGWVGDQDRKLCQDAGFSDQMIKPIDLEELLGLIRERLSNGRP